MKRKVATLSLMLFLFGLAGLVPALAVTAVNGGPSFSGDPTANAVSTTAITAVGKPIYLQGFQVDGHTLLYEVVSGPTHGTLIGTGSTTFTASGVLLYTSNGGYTGTDTFTYRVSANNHEGTPVTTSAATATITVINSKTTINGSFPAGSAGDKIVYLLSQTTLSFDGVLPAATSVTGTLDSSGNYTVSLWPTVGMNPPAYWQAIYRKAGSQIQSTIGNYNVPAPTSPATGIDQTTLETSRVTNVSANGQITIASETAVEMLGNQANTAAASAASAAATAHNYDLVAFNPGITTPTQIVVLIPANRSFTLALTGSTCSALTAATAQTDFLVQYSSDSGSSWTTKATLRFAAAGKTCSVLSPSSTSISSGDWIQILGPGTPDVTLANISFNLKGNLP